MDSLEVAQIGVKVLRFVPFVVYAVIVILSRVVLAPRQFRAGTIMGVAGGLGMLAWLLRYFLEQTSPAPSYPIFPSPSSVFSVVLPEVAHDLSAALGLVVAFVAVASAIPKKGEPA